VITCNGSGSANASSYHWTYGDGSSSNGSVGVHAYGEPGDYTVTLTVGNAVGSDSDSTTYSVGQ
jgi:PKD repeat protein